MQPSVIESAGIRSPPVSSTDIWKIVFTAERLCACLFLLVSLPTLLVAGIVVSILSGRSPFIAHRRVGFRGQPIWVLKLRTMWDKQHDRDWRLVERLSPPANERITEKAAKDPRVKNAFAALCRRFSIDELPQLWHVARGEMALVGPRPLTQQELDTHYGPDSAEVLTRRPGLTGLWQVRGRSRLTYRQRHRLDLFLVRKWSLPLYLLILRATIAEVLRGRDAW